MGEVQSAGEKGVRIVQHNGSNPFRHSTVQGTYSKFEAAFPARLVEFFL